MVRTTANEEGYWLRRDGTNFGPFTTDQLRQRAVASDLIRHGEQWVFRDDHPAFSKSPTEPTGATAPVIAANPTVPLEQPAEGPSVPPPATKTAGPETRALPTLRGQGERATNLCEFCGRQVPANAEKCPTCFGPEKEKQETQQQKHRGEESRRTTQTVALLVFLFLHQSCRGMLKPAYDRLEVGFLAPLIVGGIFTVAIVLHATRNALVGPRGKRVETFKATAGQPLGLVVGCVVILWALTLVWP